MRADIAAGIKGHPRRATNWRLDIATVKTNPLACQPVDIWGVKVRMSGAAQIIESELVEHDEQDVLLLSGHMTMVFLCPQKTVSEAPEIECTS